MVHGNGSPSCKKPRTERREPSRDECKSDCTIPEIVALINLSSKEKKAKLVSKYVDIISEFILHKAKEASGKRGKQEVSASDIEKVIVSEGLFFLSDIVKLSK